MNGNLETRIARLEERLNSGGNDSMVWVLEFVGMRANGDKSERPGFVGYQGMCGDYRQWDLQPGEAREQLLERIEAEAKQSETRRVVCITARYGPHEVSA